MKNTHQHFTRESLANLIGIPYEEKDCWGIVTLYYKTILDIELPKYFYCDPCDSKEISPIINENKVKYKRVAKPETGDIILLRIFGVPAHVGIYLDEKYFLHTQKGVGSCIDALRKYEKRILGYYKYDQV